MFISLSNSKVPKIASISMLHVHQTMFNAGTETTAVIMEWAMSLLLNHPEAMQKVRAEIDSHVGHGRLLNDSDLANLPYLRCVVNESLRLYPSSPLLLPHFSSEDCMVGGYDIPRGTMLMVNVWAVHRDPSLWEEPSRFKPERFESTFGEKEGFRYLPFGLRRRACPGVATGMRLIFFALGAAIQCFEWENVEPDKVDMSPGSGITMSKAKPLEALCCPRSNSIELLT
ncbi:hypothetical protein REPUB_Repub19eG0052100 [Reevesia pubescens]